MGTNQDRRYKTKHKYWQIIGGQATGQSIGHVSVVKGSLIYRNSARVVVKPWNGLDNTKILEDEALGPRVSNDRRQAHSSFPPSIKYRRARGSRKRYITESAICRRRGDTGILGDDMPLESEYWWAKARWALSLSCLWSRIRKWSYPTTIRKAFDD